VSLLARMQVRSESYQNNYQNGAVSIQLTEGGGRGESVDLPGVYNTLYTP
jgi:hypothetical protein